MFLLLDSAMMVGRHCALPLNFCHPHSNLTDSCSAPVKVGLCQWFDPRYGMTNWRRHFAHPPLILQGESKTAKYSLKSPLRFSAFSIELHVGNFKHIWGLPVMCLRPPKIRYSLVHQLWELCLQNLPSPRKITGRQKMCFRGLDLR